MALGRLRDELVVELAPAHGVLVHELDARGALGVELRHRDHPVLLEAPRRLLDIAPELLALGGHAAVPRPRHHEREGAPGMPQAEVQRRVAAHAQPADMGAFDAEGVQESANVLGGLLLGIRRGVLGHVRGRIASRVEGDGPVAPRQEPHLQVPARIVAGELVDEDEGRALPRLLVEKIDAVHAGFGHGGSLLQTPEPLNRG